MADAFTTLSECSYDGLKFPVESVSTEGGNEIAEHRAYLRRGADIEPCGQKAYRGSLTIPLVNTPALVKLYGPLFPALRFDLVTKFEERPIATLVHPTLGPFPAAITGWTDKLNAVDRGGCTMEVTYVEHNALAGLLADAEGAPIRGGTPSSVSLLASLADLAMLAFAGPSLGGALGWVQLAQVFTLQLSLLEARTLSYTSMGEAFRLMLGPVASNLALPLFEGADAHEATLALLRLQAATYELQSRYQPTLDRVRIHVVEETAALWQIAQLVYGDSSKTGLLLAANSISNALAVRAGTRLTILPDDVG